LIFSVSAVTATLFGATIFIMGMKNALRIGTYRLGADILVVPKEYEGQTKSALLSGEPVAFVMNSSVIDDIKKVPGVKGLTSQLFVKPTSFTCCYNVDVFLIGFEPDTDFTVKPWLESHLDRKLKINEIIVGRDVPVKVGDTLPFFGSSFTVAGVMEPTGMNFFDRAVFMTMEAAYRMAELSKERAKQELQIKRNQISAVLVRVADDEHPDRVAIKIEGAVPGVKAIASEQIISTVRKQLKGLLKGIAVMGLIVWVIVLVLIGFTFYMVVNERQREIAILRAMGAKRAHVFSLIMLEASMISLFGGVAGIILSGSFLYIFNDLIKHTFGLPYLIPETSMLAEIVLAAIVFAEITGITAAIMPALSASRLQPYEAIRKGE